ncbi:MAG: peptidase M48, partial [Acidaminococcaceae bacterium]|nr:peptidase M48 [Acidaminococcaceae bacterium]
MKHFLKIIFSILCLLGITCSFLPAAEAGLISEKQELEMGKAAAEQIEARYGVINDMEIAERVERIGQSLVDVCGRKNIKYSFKVLNTDDVNALACPGGYI